MNSRRTTPPRNEPVDTAPDSAWIVPEALHRRPLDGVVRALHGGSWSDARKLVSTGKIRVSGDVVSDPTRPVSAGSPVTLHLRAPRPHTARVRALEADLVVYADGSV